MDFRCVKTDSFDWCIFTLRFESGISDIELLGASSLKIANASVAKNIPFILLQEDVLL